MNVEIKKGKKRSRVMYEFGNGHYENGQYYEEELTDKALIATGNAVYDVMFRAPHETQRTKRLISWSTWGRSMGEFRVPLEDGEGLAQQLRDIFALPGSTERDRDENGKRYDAPSYPQEWRDYKNKCLLLMNGHYD